ncbi:hypothetical protein BN1708_002494 [Verticillium longisporum]|uniref:Uncharacterized protein n=1 Tax=Verticillium longisporum TaxID=100787 RepID=A0A0G4KTQ8_VERLO|nr:hypothetical protein BN1708_002494 [Verticillium longisporum]
MSTTNPCPYCPDRRPFERQQPMRIPEGTHLTYAERRVLGQRYPGEAMETQYSSRPTEKRSRFTSAEQERIRRIHSDQRAMRFEVVPEQPGHPMDINKPLPPRPLQVPSRSLEQSLSSHGFETRMQSRRAATSQRGAEQVRNPPKTPAKDSCHVGMPQTSQTPSKADPQSSIGHPCGTNLATAQGPWPNVAPPPNTRRSRKKQAKSVSRNRSWKTGILGDALRGGSSKAADPDSESESFVSADALRIERQRSQQQRLYDADWTNEPPRGGTRNHLKKNHQRR